MLDRIFPGQFDNRYRGHWLGLGLFVLVLLLKGVQGIESIVQTEHTMIKADGIPLDSFSPTAAREAILMFALLGMYLLVIPLQSVIVLLRYRSMVPFMLLMLIAIQLGARGIHFLHPTDADAAVGGEPIGFYVNMALLAVTVAAFALSILRPRTRAGAGRRPA